MEKACPLPALKNTSSLSSHIFLPNKFSNYLTGFLVLDTLRKGREKKYWDQIQRKMSFPLASVPEYRCMRCVNKVMKQPYLHWYHTNWELPRRTDAGRRAFCFPFCPLVELLFSGEKKMPCNHVLDGSPPLLPRTLRHLALSWEASTIGLCLPTLPSCQHHAEPFSPVTLHTCWYPPF